MAYKPLEIETVKLADLNLDLNNYRVPVASADESAAMKYLFASEDVIGAAKLILRNGYFDNEIPVVLASSAHSHRPPYVVLEGNRRVCALKALSEPELVPSHAAEIRALLKRHALEAEDLPEEIRVMVAPTKELAIPHIARLHTGLSKKAWSPDQQANFYFSLLDASTTPADIKANFPGISVPRYLRMASMRQFLAGALFEDKSLREYVQTDALKMSALEYAYKQHAIAEPIGVQFDRDGLLVPREKTPSEIGAALNDPQLRALEILISEFRSGRLTTRSDEFRKGSEAQRKFSDVLQGNSPANDKSGKGRDAQSAKGADSDRSDNSPQNGAGASRVSAPDEAEPSSGRSAENGEENTSKGGSAPRRGPNRSDTKKRLPMEGVEYHLTPINLQNRYQELRRIDIEELPLASAILIRSIFETTIKYHFEGSATPVTGELRSVLTQVHTSYGKQKSLQGSLNKAMSGSWDTPGSLQWLNRAAHDVDAHVSAEEVRSAWKTLNPLIRHLVRKAPSVTP